MCLAIPGKIVSLNNGQALIDYSGEKRTAIAKGMVVNKGDYVLVQFGVVVQKLGKKEALEAIKNYSQLNSLPQ